MSCRHVQLSHARLVQLPHVWTRVWGVCLSTLQFQKLVCPSLCTILLQRHTWTSTAVVTYTNQKVTFAIVVSFQTVGKTNPVLALFPAACPTSVPPGWSWRICFQPCSYNRFNTSSSCIHLNQNQRHIRYVAISWNMASMCQVLFWCWLSPSCWWSWPPCYMPEWPPRATSCFFQEWRPKSLAKWRRLKPSSYHGPELDGNCHLKGFLCHSFARERRTATQNLSLIAS